jgi:hypothetical protein
MPVRHGNGVRRLGEALPDILDKLKPLGRRKLKNLISEGALAHGWKVMADAVGGKACHKSPAVADTCGKDIPDPCVTICRQRGRSATNRIQFAAVGHGRTTNV